MQVTNTVTKEDRKLLVFLSLIWLQTFLFCFSDGEVQKIYLVINVKNLM